MAIFNRKNKSNRKDGRKLAVATYREGDGVELKDEIDNFGLNEVVRTCAEFTPEFFPHIAGCDLTASYIATEENSLTADITYRHPSTTALIQIVIIPLESDESAIIVRRSLDWLSEVGCEMYHSGGRNDMSRNDHPATVKIGDRGTTFLKVLSVVGRELNESVPISTPLLKEFSSTTSTTSEKVKVVLGLDKITMCLSDRLREFYVTETETKK